MTGPLNWGRFFWDKDLTRKPDIDMDKLKPVYDLLDEGLTKHEIHAIIFHLCATHDEASKEILSGIVYANSVKDMTLDQVISIMRGP